VIGQKRFAYLGGVDPAVTEYAYRVVVANFIGTTLPIVVVVLPRSSETRWPLVIAGLFLRALIISSAVRNGRRAFRSGGYFAPPPIQVLLTNVVGMFASSLMIVGVGNLALLAPVIVLPVLLVATMGNRAMVVSSWAGSIVAVVGSAAALGTPLAELPAYALSYAITWGAAATIVHLVVQIATGAERVGLLFERAAAVAGEAVDLRGGLHELLPMIASLVASNERWRVASASRVTAMPTGAAAVESGDEPRRAIVELACVTNSRRFDASTATPTSPIVDQAAVDEAAASGGVKVREEDTYLVVRDGDASIVVIIDYERPRNPVRYLIFDYRARQCVVRLNLLIDRVETISRLETQAEDLASSNADLSQFAYVAAHDLRTPLGVIKGFAELALEDPRLDDETIDYIGHIVTAADRTAVLVDDLLDYSRIGSADLRRERVSLALVVREVLGMLDAELTARGAVVNVEDLPEVVGDAAQLRQLFHNLIENAVKFVPAQRRPELDIGARVTDEGVRITVADNGIGIAPDARERVFMMFQRLHGRDAYEGTGIGLAICRRVVERHGGTIRIDDGPAGGTAVHIFLPGDGR